MTDKRNGITYAEAGVDIDAGNALVERIKPAAKRTVRLAAGLIRSTRALPASISTPASA